jgi:nicotinate phosphoribosyltransferase
MIYKSSLALLTDLYQLTMAYGYWKTNMLNKKAVFHLNFRKMPFNGSYAIMAGLETAVEFIRNFRFEKSDIEYLSKLQSHNKGPLFDDKFLEYLLDFKFEGDLYAVEEGNLVFPYVPMLRIEAPILQAQLLESPLLNIINFQTLIATKAARVVHAAENDTVVEFGMRRAQGLDGAISASRAAYIGGCHSTSNVLAGKLFDIPIKGTHAHSWVMAFDEEAKAFSEYASIMPQNCVLLVDTYDTIEGVKKAIKVAKNLKNNDFNLLAVRLDSGDLNFLSIEIRKVLDSNGFVNTKIMASNELDEYLIRDLKKQGTKVTIWGVGTKLVTANDQPALDGVYKLSAITDDRGKWKYKLKLSEQTAKSTNPGILQTRRFFKDGKYFFDVIYDEKFQIDQSFKAVHVNDFSKIRKGDPNLEYKDLLIPIIKKGKITYKFPTLNKIRSKSIQEVKKLSFSMQRFLNPEPYFVGLEKKLHDFKIDLMNKMRNV